jgi:hypothetical protein
MIFIVFFRLLVDFGQEQRCWISSATVTLLQDIFSQIKIYLTLLL